MMQPPLRIDRDDLYSAKVEGYLEQQSVLRRSIGEVPEATLLVRIIYSNYLYLSLASGLGGLLAWALLEPFFTDSDIEEGGAVNLLLFPTVAAFVGLFLGATEGLMCRQFPRASLCAAVGLGLGFVGGLIAIIPAGLVFMIMSVVAAQISPNIVEGEMPGGFAFLILMMGRGAAWSLAAIPAGIGQGIALREKRVVLNGLLGGVLGGLAGGLLFDPIYMLFGQPQEAAASRAVGFAVIGVLVGLFVGLVENWTRTAWLHMKAGPLAGKQFVLYRNPTVIGSAPKSDIYLFKDDSIEPRHALVHNRGGRFEIEDLQTPDGTYVNGVPVTTRILQNGDQIVVGKTMFEFSLRENRTG